MVSYNVFVARLNDDEIEVVESLDTDREYIATDHIFDSEESAKQWVKDNSTHYVIRVE